MPVILLTIGVAVAASGITGAMRDLAGAVPVRWPSSATGRPPEAVRWLRACPADPRCRQPAAALLGASAAGHGRALWGGLLVGIASAAWLGVLRLRSQRPRRSVGDARFASRAELRRLTRRSPGAWFPLGYARRWPLPRRGRPGTASISRLATAWAQPVRLPEEDLARHVLVVGLTGAHKTTSVVFPVLLEAARAGVSVVALDLKYGEADSLARAAQEWQRWARDVQVFAPLEATTLRWNPLAGCRSIGDAQQLASQLFDDPDPSDADMVYWVGAERHICAVLCCAVGADGGPPTLGRLRNVCESGPAGVQAYVRAHPQAPMLTARLGAYFAMLPKDQAGILQGIATRLEAWGDEAVRGATEGSAPWEQIDLGRLRREPSLLIVGVPQGALGRLRWLCHLFLQNLAAHLLRPRGPEERVRVLLVLEELPGWGALPGLAEHLATYRSRQVSVLATLQSDAQGEYVYGRDGWAAVSANLVTKLYLPSLGDLDAERLSRVLGTAAGEDIASSRGWGAAGSRKGEQRRAIPIPLQRPEELRGIGSSPDETLVRFARIPPARLWCPPYYLRPEYADRVPDRLPTTAELVIYHHLWARRTHADATAGVAAAGPAPRPDPPVAGEAAHGAEPAQPAPRTPLNDHAPGDDATADDIAQLNRLVEALLLPSGPERPAEIRAVRGGGRIVEIRADPRDIVRACGRPDVMHGLARRWSALRWVRRVRPSFILSRRALDALDPRLARRLFDVCARDIAET